MFLSPNPPTNRLSTWITLASILAILLAACQPGETPAPTPEPRRILPSPTEVPVEQLYANPWVLLAYGDSANPAVVEGGLVVTAIFSPDGTLSGQSTCNQYSASFTAETDGSLSVAPQIVTTMMMCAEEQMQVEQAYLLALPLAKSFTFSPEGRLVITIVTASAEDQVLIYAVGQAPLAGTAWTLVSYGDPVAQQPVPAGLVITANFGFDSKLTGSGGCNSYSTSYTAQDGQITIQPIATTLMACPSGMEQEQAYLSALATAQSYQVVSRNLAIVTADGQQLTYTSHDLPLENTLWFLVNQDGAPISSNVSITLLLTPEAKDQPAMAGGLAGCNQYSGGYTVDGNRLTFSAMTSTRMMCEEQIMTAEQAYLAALQSSQSFQVLGPSLVIATLDGSLTFAADRTPLTGALWVLQALGDLEDPQPLVTGSNFTAQFTRFPDAPSGVLAGTTGCNEYSAAFTASPIEIKINLPASTAITTCVPGLRDQEQLYFLALNNATDYTILGDTLLIPYDDGKQALVFAATQVGQVGKRPLSDLHSTRWYLWSIDDQPILNGTSITADFTLNPDGQSGVMSGSAGCNLYQATHGADLGIETALNSDQVCASPAGVMEQETAYLAALSRAYGYWLTLDQLIVNTGQGALTYRSTPAAQSSDQAHLLQATPWYLVSYNTSVSAPGQSGDPNLSFKADGALTGYTGCNTLQGRYTTDLNQITITGLSQTLTACPNNVLAAQERAMLDVLLNARTYQVFDSAMQLVGDQGVLNFYYAPVNQPGQVVPPNAVIDAPSSALASQPVTFDASRSTAQAPITSYSWDFGDKKKGSGPTVTHVYSAPGQYYVQMTVTDARGYRSSASMTITINPPVAPTLQPTPPIIPTVPPTQQPKPTLAPTIAPLPTAEPLPTVEPTQPPLPTAEPPPMPTEVPPPTPEPTQPSAPMPPQAAITGPSQGYPGEPVTFDASATIPGDSPVVNFSWNFGDGTTQNTGGSPTATMLYNHSGVYEVTVIVTDESGQSSGASMQIVVQARLETAVWAVESLAGQPLIPGTAITLQFLSGQLVGFSGCNTYTGGYTATDNGDGTYSVTGTGLQTTQMLCPEEIMLQEQAYLASLSQTQTATIQGNVLVLTSPLGEIRLHEVGT